MCGVYWKREEVASGAFILYDALFICMCPCIINYDNFDWKRVVRCLAPGSINCLFVYIFSAKCQFGHNSNKDLKVILMEKK